MADEARESRRRVNRPNLVSFRLVGLLAFLLLLASMLTSCLLRVATNDSSAEVVASTPTPVSVAAPGGSWHDLALISVDFDPPLKPGEMLSVDHPPVLLAVADNRGNQTENTVVVKLRVTGANDSDLVATDKQTISSLAQGEARVVRFDRITSLPPRSVYTVRVEVLPASGEVNTADNVKETRVQIVAGGER